MKRKILAIFMILMLLVVALPAATVGAGRDVSPGKIPVDISHRLKDQSAPAQRYIDAVHLPSGGTTAESQCAGGTDEFLVITITSFDPANPGSQDVVFWKESVGGSATLWVAWDYLLTHFGQEDVITCDMLEYLQGTMDSIVDTDVHYFGDYVQRPAGNENIDVMIYNIVDESSFDEDFPSYIAGFFWSAINEAFDRNMIFIDSFDWPNRLGNNDSPWRGPDPSLCDLRTAPSSPHVPASRSVPGTESRCSCLRPVRRSLQRGVSARGQDRRLPPLRLPSAPRAIAPRLRTRPVSRW